MQVISFVTQKGGAAKTTTALGLACAAATHELNVGILDFDPQASAAEWGENRTTPPGVAQLDTLAHLPEVIDGARGQNLDWLVIDTPPRAGDIAAPVAEISDLVFVPVVPAVFDVRAIRPTLVELYRARAHERVRILMTLCPPRQSALFDPPGVAAARKALIEAYGEYFRIAPLSITRYEAVRAALESSRTVVETEPRSKAAAELMALYRFVDKVLNPVAEPLAVAI
jgi:chromosome partitioning protein